ncbi:MAG: lycopene beta cyclase [Cyanobacteria bacterium P01_E01_bin.34]
MFDVLVIGSGPAGMAIAAELCERGFSIAAIAPNAATVPWENTYGIWCDELEALNLTHLLSHCWTNCVSYFEANPTSHPRTYGLFDKQMLQAYLLERTRSAHWFVDKVVSIEHGPRLSTATTASGQNISARVAIDASGHQPAILQRPTKSNIAYQTAYGIVGKFSQPPIAPNQFVLMDYRSDHSTPEERRSPPTFLYAMDLGQDVYFVEETSLACCPAMTFDTLESRLHKRLALTGVEVLSIKHVERCIFPMNLPLPNLSQPVVGFGGAASMVHPASGYMVGALLRRAPELADALASALQDSSATPSEIARSGWAGLWSRDRLRKHYLYLFGLDALMGFEVERLNHHFQTFFSLPLSDWSGFLSDTLSTPELVRAMLGLFGRAPNDVRWGLMRSVRESGSLLWRSLAA